MESRHILLIVALFTSAVFVIPEIYSLFSGQHQFYDQRNSVCLKCHPDIRYDMDSSAYHTSFTCENCHVLNMSSNLTHGNVINPGCLDCHGTPARTVTDSNNNTFLSPETKVFGKNITNEESHNPFVKGAISTPFMKGENEACVSCHTAKSLLIKMLYADTYAFEASRITDSTWQLSNYSKNAEMATPIIIFSNESAGKHAIQATAQLKCEKCHSNIRNQLNNSVHHTYFSCNSCHQLYSIYHASSTPPCLECHGTAPGTVTDEKGNSFIAPAAPVYASGAASADAHMPFVSSANKSNAATGANIACSSCHSGFNNYMSFIRPSFIEWDVVNSAGTWTIQNLNFGPNIENKITKYLDGTSHNILQVTGINCTSCHEDIAQAVIAGGHSNEQWKKRHNYLDYADMNSYCKSCHQPVTTDTGGSSPYPAYPFNSPSHGAITISCFDCHGKNNLNVSINGVMKTPPYDGSEMGHIEASVGQQPVFIQSYLCISCKNTGNPVPNGSLHFKMYTEPQVTIYINGTQRYP
ncbi:MAG TPA: hypothetical protein VIO58_02065 [Candidatus Methanoperedens sp.]